MVAVPEMTMDWQSIANIGRHNTLPEYGAETVPGMATRIGNICIANMRSEYMQSSPTHSEN